MGGVKFLFFQKDGKSDICTVKVDEETDTLSDNITIRDIKEDELEATIHYKYTTERQTATINKPTNKTKKTNHEWEITTVFQSNRNLLNFVNFWGKHIPAFKATQTDLVRRLEALIQREEAEVDARNAAIRANYLLEHPEPQEEEEEQEQELTPAEKKQKWIDDRLKWGTLKSFYRRRLLKSMEL